MNRDGTIPLSISVQGNILLPANIIKVLGISLEPGLRFDSHVKNICVKAARQINVLKRLSKYLSLENRMLLYKSFIASNFHYCPVSWMFCGKRNSDKIEKIQERAIRFVYCDHSSEYKDLLKRGNLLSLAADRVRFLAIEMFKCVKELNPDYLNSIFQLNETPYSMRDLRLKQPKWNTVRYGYKSFKYYEFKVWNSLPNDMKDTDSLQSLNKSSPKTA